VQKGGELAAMPDHGGSAMTDDIAGLTRHDLEAKIVKRCWEDEEFRREFSADPAGTFAKHLQVPTASLPKIVVHEEAAGSWHIVLPAPPSNAEELSEQDLERVAGGGETMTYVTTLLLTAAGFASASAAVSVAAQGVQKATGW
jgi:hypothetical protein